jgi:hypothetical protein
LELTQLQGISEPWRARTLRRSNYAFSAVNEYTDFFGVVFFARGGARQETK